MSALRGNTVRIAELKAKLSAYLRNVRGGHSLTVLDRETPIARVVPYAEDRSRLVVRKSTLSAKEIRLPRAPTRRTNSLKVLLADRENGR
ncbi:MAG: type II toxin-antitoxin system prevent-host-death family antitoxin [Nitrospirae bacterium]|nr:type II toxin-antitoxin system prevent-host-death family antitoxin [Nitrospirota bacterium]